MYGILIDNAIEATNKNQLIKKMIISLEKKGSFNHITVSNMSNFIPAETINKFTTKGYTSKNGNGHGIGMSKLNKMLNKKRGSMLLSYDANSKMFNAEIYHL